MPNRLQNCVAVVTGAGSGIGRAIALELGRQGAVPWLVGRDARKLETVREIIQTPAATVHRTDLQEDRDIEMLVEAISQRHDRVDILVHAAGAIAFGPIESAPVEELDRQFHINVRAPYLLTQRLFPLLRKSQGQVVFINSSVGLRGKEGVGAYSTTKHALKGLADTLRLETNASGMRVLSVFPGNTATPMQEAVQEHTGQRMEPAYLLQPEDVAAVIVHSLSLPRTAEVTDIHIRPFRKAPA